MRPERKWVVYLVRCADNSLYCGVTTDLNKRLAAHNRGQGAKYTRSRRPVTLVDARHRMTKSEALRLEYRIKKTAVERKRDLLVNGEGQPEMRTTQILKEIQKELQTVVTGMQQLTDCVRNIVAAIEKLDAGDSPPPKTKRGPVRKKVVVRNGVVEKIKRIPATKIVYDILKKSGKGMDTAELMKATGFDQRKIHNITFRLKKNGKIIAAERGVYKIS